MDIQVLKKAIITLFSRAIFVSLLLFLSAGTIAYFNGWLLIVSDFIILFALYVFLFFKNPELLKKRLDTTEDRESQYKLTIFWTLLKTCGFIVAGLDFRFHWYIMPQTVIWVGFIVFLIGYALLITVMLTNTYLSSSIKPQDNQKLIDTGVYRLVRHPFYLSDLIIALSTAFVLNSLCLFIVFLIAYPMVLVIRIKDEEKFLEEELEGYQEYKQKVKYRLVPFIW